MPSGNNAWAPDGPSARDRHQATLRTEAGELEMHSYAVIVTGFWKVLYTTCCPPSRPQDLALATELK
ncbi:Hypothetical protein FKW44_010671 [Caligus rogercresseyi]|uniref:Uncharacterized protein n=1 Tax=Caligus rogercresseyi TaxID=217165 RepID=A0A7T8HGW8_CALRO|nr:Hypothetical protein FKW44_010671 [Caligus rogercresseyi]